MPEMLTQMNPHLNPEVRNGRKTIEACRREILEYYGGSNAVIFPNQEFILEETDARRRRPPIGSLYTPIDTPAGKPSAAKGAAELRSVKDVKNEISVHPAKENHDIKITVLDFEEKCKCLSLLIPDDDDFEHELREMWGITEPGGLAVDASHHGFVLELEDGSRKLIKLRDDKNLENTAGAAGFSTGVFKAMGPEVAAEVKRRLEKQSGHKIAKFTWA